MKTKLPLIAALYCGLSSIGSAFTLDFSGLSLGTLAPFTINVPGYGDVNFSPGLGSALTIEEFAPGATKAISFDKNESVIVTFLGAEPINVANEYIGVGIGEFFTFDLAGTDPNVFLVTLNGTGQTANAGLQSVIFEQVPEPSTSLLGALGTALLVLRRRR